MKVPRTAAVLSVVAIVLIIIYSGYRMDSAVASNAPIRVPFTPGTAYRDVTYCNSQTLDLYVPTQASERSMPLAIYVHGGGLNSGDKTDINPTFLKELASAGYAVASVNYRLAPMYKFPAQIEDVKCAIRYLRDHAQAYGLNASEFFVFGTSSGGELAALAALTGGDSAFDVGPYLNEPSGVAAAVDMFGPANLSKAAGYSPADTFRDFGDNLTAEVLASPTHFVAPHAPPILIIHGLNDTQVPESQSVELYNDLTAAGDQTQLVLVQNMGHMFVQVGPNPIAPSVAQLGQDVVAFFEQYTRGGS